MRRIYCGLAAIAFGLLCAPALTFADSPVSVCDALGSQNLVKNCGFETGDFTDWNLSGNLDGHTFVSPDDFGAGSYSGQFFAALGAVGSPAIMTQTLSTDIGQEYTFTFELDSDGATPNQFVAKWGGVTVFDQTDIPYFRRYHTETFFVTATDTQTTIEFDSQNDPGFLALDDVSVVTPEPSFAFLATALLALPLLRFRRNRGLGYESKAHQ